MPLSDSATYDAIEQAARAKMAVPAAASEAHVGEVGGRTATQTVALTVTAGSAYASGQVIGGKTQFNAMSRVANLTGMLQWASIHAKSAQSSAIDLLIFHADPTASTFTDKQALALNVADFDKLAGIVRITDWTTLGTPSYGQAGSIGMPYRATGTSLWVVPVARATPTFASISDLSVSIKSFVD